MTAIEIVLLLGGALLFIASFLIPERKNSSKTAYDRTLGMKIDRMIDEKAEEMRIKVKRAADDANEESELQSKRELERITNEKIMAIDDYAKVVLQDIEKNHKEVVFLYDMLENKTSDLKNTIREADHIRMNSRPGVMATEMAMSSSAAIQEPVAHTAAEAPAPPVQSGMDRLLGKMAQARKMEAAPAQVPVPQPVQMPAAAALVEPEEVAVGQEEFQGELNPADKAALDQVLGSGVSRNDRVLALHKEGISNVEIAKELNMGVGEVNLIIDLYEAEDSGGSI